MMRIISITELRRNFGEATSDLTNIDALILTKGGEPFAIMKASPEEKRKAMKKAIGSWKGTDLDNDKLWKEVFKRKSRKTSVTL